MVAPAFVHSHYMLFTDTHAHLTFPEFDGDRDAVIQRAREAGVRRMIVIGIDVETSRAAIALAEQHDGMYATVGIHPNCVGPASGDDFDEIARLAEHAAVVGIGESGLDFYRDHTPPDKQTEAFRWHIRLAGRCGKPVIVHDRDAHDAVLDVLKAERAAGADVVLHCFSGDAVMAATAVKAGYHISFGGPVTFKKSPLAAVVPRVPDDRLLIETDAPYLAPTPFRGRRNEPARLVHTAGAIAAFRRVSLDEIAAITSQNASAVFRLNGVC